MVMDLFKKRKLEENGIVNAELDYSSPLMLTDEDTRKILDLLTHDQLLQIVRNALIRHSDVLDAVRSYANRDVTRRKLFIRGLGWETTTEKLISLFSSYGELEEATVVNDKATGKSKGYGFITFKHIDGAMMALKEPRKKIDGRMTVTQLATAGNSGGGGGGGGGVNNYNSVDVLTRKIYVGNVPRDMRAERLLGQFSVYGEIEEGPLGFDKATGKFKGFALFVYKTAEAAQASLIDPVKNVDGHQLTCKLANDVKTGKPHAPWGAAAAGAMGLQGGIHGNEDGIGATRPGGQYSGQNNIGFSDGIGAGIGGAAGGPALPVMGSQYTGSNLGDSGGFSSYTGGSHFGGPLGTVSGGSGGGLGGTGSGLGVGTGLGGPRGVGSGGAGLGGAGGGFGFVGSELSGLGGPGSGMGLMGRGSSYRLPPTSAGMGSRDYSLSGHYILSSNSGYKSQHNQPAQASTVPRVPPGRAYQGMPPYY